MGPDFSDDDVNAYLERFREHVRAMPNALTSMSEKHGRRALAYMAFALGADKDFRPIVSGLRPSDMSLEALYNNNLGITPETVSHMINRAGYKIPRSRQSQKSQAA